MTKEREELERKVDLLLENIELREKGKEHSTLIGKLQKENQQLRESVDQLKGPSLGEKIKASYKPDGLVSKIALTGAYAAELYFLGPIIHKHMHSLAQFMYHGYDYFIKSSPNDPISAFVFHVIGDGVGGIVVGAATGFVVGGTVEFTKSLLKLKEFDIPRGLGAGALAACGGAVSGLLGAEFSGTTGIMIMSYIGMGISLVNHYKNN